MCASSALLASSAAFAASSISLLSVDASSTRTVSPIAIDVNTKQVELAWDGIDLRLPHDIAWTSASSKSPEPGRHSYLAKGRDARGPVELLVAERDGYIAATMLDGSGVRWRSNSIAGQPIVFQADSPEQAKKGCGGTPEPSAALQAALQAAAAQSNQSNDGGVAGECYDSDDVTILVVYTACAVFQAGGIGPLYSGVDLTEDLMNLAFRNSKIDETATQGTTRTIRIVGVLPSTDYVPGCGTSLPCYDPDSNQWCGENKTFEDYLNEVTNPGTALGGYTANMRDYLKADLVVLLRNSSTDGVAGLAWKKGSFNCGEATAGNLGFCVVDVTTLGDTTLPHEVGHLFGCCHAYGDQGGGCNGANNLWAYSNGHRFIADDFVMYGTIMAYPPATTITHFSNPDVYYEGKATGSPQGSQDPTTGHWDDNARLIRDTFSDVRCYRCSELEPPPPETVITYSGFVKAWGWNNSGQTDVPATLGKCIVVDAGAQFSVAIQETLSGDTPPAVLSYGLAKAWGLNSSGQTTVPVSLGNCSAISAGAAHVLALRWSTDPLVHETVVAWGANTSGQTVVPGSLGACKAVAAGGAHSLAIKKGGANDGLIAGWGLNSNGQTTPPTGSLTYMAVAAGSLHSLGLTTEGTPRAWGSSTNGQTSVPPGLTGCTRIEAGDSHSLVLKSDGTVLAWGLNTFGQATVPASLGSCLAIAGGTSHSSSIKKLTATPTPPYGDVVCWGAGLSDTGTVPNYGQSIVPATFSGAYQVADGGYHTLAVVKDVLLANCSGDFNGDGSRDGIDLTTLLSGWGTINGDCNNDGTTDGTDLTFLLSGWGSCE